MSSTLVIFDVDGTLVYSERRDSKSFASAYKEVFLKEFPTIDWSQFKHVTDTVIFNSTFEKQFGRRVEEYEFLNFKKLYLSLLSESRRQAPHHFKEVPSARECIDRLRSDGFEVAVATGGWEDPARLKLSHANIDGSSIKLSGADGKVTREEIINAAIHQVKDDGVSIERIVYIGDAVWDVQTTARMNMDFIGVRWRGDLEVLHREGANTVIQDYRDYDGFLSAIERAAPPVVNAGMQKSMER